MHAHRMEATRCALMDPERGFRDRRSMAVAVARGRAMEHDDVGPPLDQHVRRWPQLRDRASALVPGVLRELRRSGEEENGGEDRVRRREETEDDDSPPVVRRVRRRVED